LHVNRRGPRASPKSTLTGSDNAAPPTQATSRRFGLGGAQEDHNGAKHDALCDAAVTAAMSKAMKAAIASTVGGPAIEITRTMGACAVEAHVEAALTRRRWQHGLESGGVRGGSGAGGGEGDAFERFLAKLQRAFAPPFA
jgi:hypothetical protein